MVSNNQKTLINQIIIKEPLKVENERIIDDEHEEYAIIQNEKLIFCNGKPLSMDILSIVSIEKETKGKIKVRTIEGVEQFYDSKLSPSMKPLLDHDGSISDLNKAIDYILIGIDRYLYYDVLKGNIMIDLRLYGDSRTGVKNLTDTYISSLRIKFEEESKRVYGKKLRFSRDTFREILELKAENNKINSFLKKIESTKWDGKERVRFFLHEMKASIGSAFNGTPEDLQKANSYLQWLSQAIFLSSIERQYENRPIQFMPMLIGEQQCGKSLLCERLGLTDYYTSLPPSFKTDNEQKYMESVQGKVIVEVKEGWTFKDHEDEMKALLDKTEVQYRRPYHIMTDTFKIHNILIMTTNHGQILTDITGNRRYFPIYIEKMPTEQESPIVMATDEYFKQLWAESLIMYRDGMRWNKEVSDHREILERIRSAIISEPEGFDEIRSFLDDEYENIGDKVTAKSIKDMLCDRGYGTKKDNLMRRFKDKPEYFGFVKLPNTSIRDKNTKIAGKGFERIKKPENWDRSEIEQWTDEP